MLGGAMVAPARSNGRLRLNSNHDDKKETNLRDIFNSKYSKIIETIYVV